MALDLTAEQKELGKANFQAATDGLSRRGFMKSVAAGAAVVPVGAAVYFGYESIHGKPVKAALIGETFMRAADIGAKLRELRGVIP